MDDEQQDVVQLIDKLRKRLPEQLYKIHREYVGRSIVESDPPCTSHATTQLDTIVTYVDGISVGSRVFASIDEVNPFIGATVTLVATGERLPRSLAHLHMKIHVPQSRMLKIDKAMTNHIFLFDIIQKIYPPEPELPTVDLELTIPLSDNRKIVEDCGLEQTESSRISDRLSEKEQRYNVSKIDWYAQRIGVPTRLVETCSDLPIAPLSLLYSICEPIESQREMIEVFRPTIAKIDKPSVEHLDVDIIGEPPAKKARTHDVTATSNISPDDGTSSKKKEKKQKKDKKKEQDEKRSRKADLEKLKNFHEMLKRAK